MGSHCTSEKWVGPGCGHYCENINRENKKNGQSAKISSYTVYISRFWNVTDGSKKAGKVNNYPGERNRGISCEACCSSKTTRYHAHSCQLALNRGNRAISGDIVAQSSVIEPSPGANNVIT